ncbi:MAG: hypothetical protein KDD45_06655 [Bdellovibrionales bacterium]|nr:hypothetical protein [Bdellovibrionales bacterium]
MTETDPKKLFAFLITWTGFSINMTTQVENWIQRAGKRSMELNHSEVGERLLHHANQEADHDKMLVTDLKFLLTKWNQSYSQNVRYEDIVSLSDTQETENYVALHERVINSNYPYAQTAIELEIERISVVYGPRFVENIINVLGSDIEPGITFLEEHVLLDQGHTKFNIDLLERCLANEGSMQHLVEAGSSALESYSNFLTMCMSAKDSILGNQWTNQLTV